MFSLQSQNFFLGFSSGDEFARTRLKLYHIKMVFIRSFYYQIETELQDVGLVKKENRRKRCRVKNPEKKTLNVVGKICNNLNLRRNKHDTGEAERDQRQLTNLGGEFGAECAASKISLFTSRRLQDPGTEIENEQ